MNSYTSARLWMMFHQFHIQFSDIASRAVFVDSTHTTEIQRACFPGGFGVWFFEDYIFWSISLVFKHHRWPTPKMERERERTLSRIESCFHDANYRWYLLYQFPSFPLSPTFHYLSWNCNKIPIWSIWRLLKMVFSMPWEERKEETHNLLQIAGALKRSNAWKKLDHSESESHQINTQDSTKHKSRV